MKKFLPFLLCLIAIMIFVVGCSERPTAERIRFESNGGTEIAEIEKEVESFPVSQKDGYRIEGWYLDKTLTERVSFPFSATEDTLLYANWVDINVGNNEIQYEKTEDGTGYIAKRYTEKGFSVYVPDTHSGLPVKEIANGFFTTRSYVFLFGIGKNIEKIDEEFYRCPLLNRFEINGANKYFSLKNNALFDVKNNKIYAYPRGKTISEYTADCIIGKNAFSYNSSIKKIFLGKNAGFESGAFSEMNELSEINVNEENGNLKSDNGILYSKNNNILYRYPQKKKGRDFIIPDSVLTVVDGAFYGTELEKITLGKNVSEFNDYSEIPFLTKFAVKEGNEYYSAYSGVLFDSSCKNLCRFPCGKEGEFVVESGVKEIFPFAFSNGINLQKIIIASSVTKIGGYAFSGCANLSKVVFEVDSGLKKIESGAFSDCDSLTALEITSRKPPETDDFIFSSVNDNFKLIVPENAEKIYEYYWEFAKRFISADGRALTTYTLTFDTMGGQEISSYHGVFFEKEVVPEKEGRVFLGWYDNPDLYGFKVEFPLIIDEHMTLYADWGFANLR